MLISEEAECSKESKRRVFCMKDEPRVYRVWMPNCKTPGILYERLWSNLYARCMCLIIFFFLDLNV
jgi:hypothetical protein